MKLSALCRAPAAVAALALISSHAAGAEIDSPAWRAATSVRGFYDTEIDILHICQEIDGQNVAAYNSAIVTLAQIANPALNQIEAVMLGEAQRAGKSADFVAEAKQESEEIALLTAEDNKKTPEKLLSDCRFTPSQARDHVGIFAPLRNQFPREMHVIEQWR